jgi:hypothetical protein
MPALHDDEIELANAILAGASRRPVQSFGEYYGPEGGSCALGAAYEGIHLLPRHVEHFHPKVWRVFHILENVSRSCPEGCKKHIPIGALIVHLNDDHHWSREQIAEWVRGEVADRVARTNEAGPETKG